ncbi:MAG: nucleotidyltransferase family protein [Chloroflexota bacterium]|nr:nucleotidyltransferase family protein [Chloroflexota bacterium]MDE2840652.1 nucleotidyltransferase family protein [Chloroflexota bacterium]MDE2931992.1 nucleotidyltransferase family protein [Chloroflexota bacterium]
MAKQVRATPQIPVPQEQIAAVCQRYHIRTLALFGSVLREDFAADSDVDVLVEFEPGRTPGYFTLARIARELSALLGGREIDIRTPQDLSRYFRDEVVNTAFTVYGKV